MNLGPTALASAVRAVTGGGVLLDVAPPSAAPLNAVLGSIQAIREPRAQLFAGARRHDQSDTRPHERPEAHEGHGRNHAFLGRVTALEPDPAQSVIEIE